MRRVHGIRRTADRWVEWRSVTFERGAGEAGEGVGKGDLGSAELTLRPLANGGDGGWQSKLPERGGAEERATISHV